MTNTAAPIEPRECPFCGKQPVVRRSVDEYGADAEGSGGKAGEYETWVNICCDDCGIEVGDEYRSEAIAAWNRRKDGLGTVSVKPLEWEAKGDALRKAAAPFGFAYFVNIRTSMWIGQDDDWAVAADPFAACQSDFETRVKSCLTSIGVEAGK